MPPEASANSAATHSLDSFLDEPVSMVDGQHKRRRASKACFNCRKRKTKCHIENEQQKCVRCIQEGLTCEVPEVEKRGGYGNVLAGKARRQQREIPFDAGVTNNVDSELNRTRELNLRNGQVSSEEQQFLINSLLQLRGASRMQRPEDIRSIQPPPLVRHQSQPASLHSSTILGFNEIDQFELPHSNYNRNEPTQKPKSVQTRSSLLLNSPRLTGVSSVPGSPVADSPSAENLLRRDMYNTDDAIDILVRVSKRKNDSPGVNKTEKRFKSTENYSQNSTPSEAAQFKDYTEEEEAVKNDSNQKCTAVDRLMNSSDTTNETFDFRKLSMRRVSIHECAIVVDGTLTPEEVCKFVGYFFTEFSPFYVSYIPNEYQEFARIAAEPALLAVVCTMGARCLEGPEHDHIHGKLWGYTQHTISKMLWECPMHHVRSLVFAVLILCEWFPGTLLDPSQPPGESLRRHTRICWPLMGQVVRVAKYVGLLKHDIQANIALHFTDHLLAGQLGQQPMLNHVEGAEPEFPEKLVSKCKLIDRARLDVVKLLNLANHSLYRSRTETRKLLASGQYMSILDLIHQLVKKWKSDYREIIDGNSWESRTLMFEFCHFELYVFSIVLIPWQKSSVSNVLREFDNTNKYLDIATHAACSIINHESSTDLPVKLNCSPIQWITRLLHASVYLAKVLLSQPNEVVNGKNRELVAVLERAAKTMQELPPDDHRVYSLSLELICRRFRLKMKHGTEPRALEKYQERAMSNRSMHRLHEFPAMVSEWQALRESQSPTPQLTSNSPERFDIRGTQNLNGADELMDNEWLHNNRLSVSQRSPVNSLDNDYGLSLENPQDDSLWGF